MFTVVPAWVVPHTLSCDPQTHKQLPSPAGFLTMCQIPLRSPQPTLPGTPEQQEGLWEGGPGF